MLKTAALAIVISGLMAGLPLCGPATAATSKVESPKAGASKAAGAPAKPGAALYISIYGAARTPDIDPTDGSVHAFMCLSPAKSIGPADECFAFRPKPEALNLVKFASGGSITRSGDIWTESPAGFHFAQKSQTRDRLVITDASRGITWSLPLPKGVSTITNATASGAWYKVVGVGYEDMPAGAVAGPGVSAHGLQDNPARPATGTAVFSRKIDPMLRTDLYSIINRWNAKTHALNGDDCLDLMDALTATVGATRPPHDRGLTAAAYVAALNKLNP